MEFKNLVTDNDLQLLHELKRISPEIKSKIFSLGRIIDKFAKLVDQLGKPNDIPKADTDKVKV